MTYATTQRDADRRYKSGASQARSDWEAGRKMGFNCSSNDYADGYWDEWIKLSPTREKWNRAILKPNHCATNGHDWWPGPHFWQDTCQACGEVRRA